ncbi:hypothetical protein H4R33_002130 [Dimargaris cristalligena]|uniref:STEEP1 domain-containing protein n=1 Tax=Dimargaris cristalligena TaxID=215637 RepID=A0A4Q0A380_9FUNG|nr:hypothetical protein H4R33_002130 [Dimargaris cristalligena]RKP39710.1 hypothetical protein BJ085DRAFT_34255 [Dimargaris cristalligena]|eukprot:RKP39710.1 hypothetical protein BJ085DRAFT_34255 [Dimargaris cristalligena]
MAGRQHPPTHSRPYRPREKPISSHVYYCLCGEYNLILVSTKPLSDFPQRITDSAYIIDNTQIKHSWNAKRGETVLLKRSDGYEQQERYHCRRCDLLVGYKATGESHSGDYSYILATALTEAPGAVPVALQNEVKSSLGR